MKLIAAALLLAMTAGCLTASATIHPSAGEKKAAGIALVAGVLFHKPLGIAAKKTGQAAGKGLKCVAKVVTLRGCAVR